MLYLSRKGKTMKNKKTISILLALSMFLQAFLIFPGYALAEELSTEEDAEESVVYILTFIVDGKVAQSRPVEAGKALGPLPQIWASDGEILSSWQCDECPVNADTIATSDMVLTAA